MILPVVINYRKLKVSVNYLFSKPMTHQETWYLSWTLVLQVNILITDGAVGLYEDHGSACPVSIWDEKEH